MTLETAPFRESPPRSKSEVLKTANRGTEKAKNQIYQIPKMEDFWKRAKSFAEEAAKKSQTLTLPNKLADLVAETAKKSKELAVEATKKADELKTAALKQADQIQIQSISKSISDFIPPQLSSLSISSPASTSSDPPPIPDSELRKFGLTDDLRDFVRGFTSTTFQNFPSPVQGKLLV